MYLVTLVAYVAVAKQMEVGGGQNRERDLAGAEKGTGRWRWLLALISDCLHEEDPYDIAVRMEVTALAGVVWFDGEIISPDLGFRWG